MPDVIPDVAELEAIEQQLLSANERLARFSEQLEQFNQSYAQIKAVTQVFSRGDASIITQQIPMPEGQAIDSITIVAQQVQENVTALDERVDNVLTLVDEPLTNFNEYVETTQQTIEAIGEWAETLVEAVDSILIEKADLIRQNTEALSDIRQDKLQKGQDWVYQEVQRITERLMQELLGDITTKLEEYAKGYQQTIGLANNHVENLNQQVENSVGRVADQLHKVTEVLERIKPVLKIAEEVLA